MKVLSDEEVTLLLDKNYCRRTNNKMQFKKELDGLKIGEALMIDKSEWIMVSEPTKYYYMARSNKVIDYRIKVRIIGESYLFVKCDLFEK